MLRILLVILVVISSVLAVLLQMFELLGVAALLAVVLIGTWYMQWRRKKNRTTKVSEAKQEESSREAELAALGISEVRPRGSKPEDAAEDISEDGHDESVAHPAVLAAEPKEDRVDTGGVRPAAVQRIGTRRRGKGVNIGVDDDRFATVLAPYLQSLRAAIGAQTVCLLKQEDIEPHYQIEAIVSQNAYARSGGQFTAREPLFQSAGRQEVVVMPVGRSGLDPASLGYYREQIKVKHVAVAAVPSSDGSAVHFLLADSMNDEDLNETYRRSILAQYAGVLRSILDMLELESSLDDGEVPQPRREIVEEEMARAREDGKTLMFALVHLNDSEAIAADGRIAVAAAERALEAALRIASDDRVERFGELTYGVLHHSEDGKVEDWAQSLQQSLQSGRGALKGGTSIGIAVMRDRHESAESFREDATEALREAYETGTCTILD